MPVTRITLAQPLESRVNPAGGYPPLSTDSVSKNCYFETRDGVREIIKRPGVTTFPLFPGPITPGQAYGMYEFNNNLYAVVDTTVYQISTGGVVSTIGTISAPPLTFPLIQCSFNETANSAYMTLNNRTHLYTLTSGGTFAVASQLDTILTSLGLGTRGLAQGVVYLDGYTFVMTSTGRIYSSGIEDPTTWNALNFVTAEAEPDGGIGIVKHFNYLVAFGEWSTEFFYDAQNATGSPLSRNDSARLEIGCASGGSISKIEQSILWVGKSKTHGKAVYIFDGLSPVKVSTPTIERFLNLNITSDIKSYTFKIEGHTFYVMTLHTSDVTFVYDLEEKQWYNWTTYISVIEHYFRPVFYTEFNNGYYCIDDDTSVIYTISTRTFQDDSTPIYFRVITNILDSGTVKPKFYRSLEIVGDKVAGTMQIRHSDNDYQNVSPWRNVDLSTTRPIIYQCGRARRRSWEFLCTDNVPLRLAAAEINFDVGELESEPGQQAPRR